MLQTRVVSANRMWGGRSWWGTLGAVTGDLCPAEGTRMSMQPQMMATAFCPNKVFDAGIHVLHRWLVSYLMVTFICGYFIVQPGQSMGYLTTAMGMGWTLVCHGLLACLLPSAAHAPTTEALAVCLRLLFFVAFPSPPVCQTSFYPQVEWIILVLIWLD